MSFVNEFEIKRRVVNDMIDKLEDIVHRNIITHYGREDYANAHFAGANEMKEYIRDLITELKSEFPPADEPEEDNEPIEIDPAELNQLVKELEERTANACKPW